MADKFILFSIVSEMKKHMNPDNTDSPLEDKM